MLWVLALNLLAWVEGTPAPTLNNLVTGAPHPTSGSFYMYSMRVASALTHDQFIYQLFSADERNQNYFKTYLVKTQQYFDSPPQYCTDLWGPLLLYIDAQEYTITDDPGAIKNKVPGYLPIHTIRKCVQASACKGCNFEETTGFSYISFVITSDDKARTIVSYGVCRGWIQVDCATLTTCNNGEFATNYRTVDPGTSFTIYAIQCLPCLPGTWNTCRTSSTQCSW